MRSYSLLDVAREQLGLSILKMDSLYSETRKADVVTEGAIYDLRGTRHHKEEFTAPLFLWELKDGRRFCGRPHVALREHAWKCLIFGGVTHEFDDIQMMQELGDMVRKSMAPDFVPDALPRATRQALGDRP